MQHTAWSPPQLGATDEGWRSIADAFDNAIMAALTKKDLSRIYIVGS